MKFIDRITKYAKINPEQPAFINNSLSTNDKVLTYKELSEYSDKLAGYIHQVCKTKKPIIIYGHKHPYMLLLLLSVIKSGRAYCPIDITIPKNRVLDIVNDIDAELIFTTEDFPIKNMPVIELKQIKEIVAKQKELITKEHYLKWKDLFYVIYTSGSTGKPKGVEINSECVHNFLSWAERFTKKEIKNIKNPIFINQAPFSFDVSVMDLFLALYLNGTIWTLDKQTQLDMPRLLESLKESNANVFISTPSFCNLCLSDDSFNADLCPHIKLFFFCGETLHNNIVEQLHNKFPSATVKNGYGPTETTVVMTQMTIDKKILNKYNPIPIGRRNPNIIIEIIDEDEKVLQEGEIGEILISGGTVSTGYYNNKELTQKLFRRKIFNGEELRSYKSGDIGFLQSGMLFYCGRKDSQIKLNGYRIELDDIENNLLKLDNVQRCAVVYVKNVKFPYLAAFIELKSSIIKEIDEIKRIKKELSTLIPLYMVPKKIKFIEKFPLTTNGKIDKQKLMDGMK